MKNLFKVLFFSGIVSASMISCSDDNPWMGSDSEGGINLHFSTDGRVMRQSRGDDSMSPVLPDESLFAINLAKTDGSFAKDWTNVEAFNRESAFPIGDYTISAAYGDIDVEGFTNPYYNGSAEVHVSPGAESQVNVVATLANSMVSVRYTPEFCEYFSAYSASLQTEGHQWVVFAQNEERPAYMSPSEVKMNLTLTNQNNQQVTIQPASFLALPRHHYIVTIGLQDSYGNVSLDVQFEDNVVAETIAVSLGDELFTAPAPTVIPSGFDINSQAEVYEYVGSDTKTQFDVFAFGGLKSTSLNVISSNGYVPSFGSSAELVNANALTQSQLSTDGVECSGFFKNVDKLGIVNFTGLLERLPAGTYTIQLQAVDAMTRVSDPSEFKVKVNPLVLEFSTPRSVDFMSPEIVVDVETNYPDVKNKIEFKAQDANNRMVDAKILSIETLATRSADYIYRYHLEIERQGSNVIDVSASFKRRTISTEVPVNEPQYALDIDPYAHQLVVKLESDDASELKTVFENLKFYNGSTLIPNSNVTHNASSNCIVINGLTAGKNYSDFKAMLGSFEKKIPTFTTEPAAEIPNGTFSVSTQTINMTSIEVGGPYTGTTFSNPKYQLVSSIVRSTPDGWANLNPLTCYSGSSNINSWFVVPCCWVENGQAVIRTVGYNHSGTTPNVTKETSVYYCKNAPTLAQLSVSPGEMFLGSYSFTGAESRVNGISWASRPATFSFEYSYSSVNGEEAEVELSILDGSGNAIARQNILLPAASSMTSKTVSLAGYAFGSRADKLILSFKSTKSGTMPTINIPSGTALNENAVGATTFTKPGNHPIAANSYKSVAVGSKLVIDNVKFGYDFSVQTLSPKKSAKKNR